MRYDIRYTMIFEYATSVTEAHNEVRVRPGDVDGQRLLAHRLTANPASRTLSFVDYWGTDVVHLSHLAPHARLEIVAEAAVDTGERTPPDTAPMDTLLAPAVAQEYVEFLAPSPHVGWDDEVAALARDAVSGADDVAGAVDAVVAATRSSLRYERGSTHIGIPIPELVELGAGVCQDFSHLTIAMLRAVRIPARYVSGYLFASDETETGVESASSVVVQTHSWVEAAIPGSGWLAVDPTNAGAVSERHVVIGHGRDYDDVAPVRGTYIGDAVPEVTATVEIRRMEPVDRTAGPQRRARVGPGRIRAIASPVLGGPGSDAAMWHQQQ